MDTGTVPEIEVRRNNTMLGVFASFFPHLDTFFKALGLLILMFAAPLILVVYAVGK